MVNFDSKGLDKSLKNFWNNLSGEQKEAVNKAHQYFVEHDVIGDAFAAAGTPLNIL